STNPPPVRLPNTPAPQVAPRRTTPAPAARTSHRHRTRTRPHQANMGAPLPLAYAVEDHSPELTAFTLPRRRWLPAEETCPYDVRLTWSARAVALRHRGGDQGGGAAAAGGRRAGCDLGAGDRPGDGSDRPGDLPLLPRPGRTR